MADEDKNIDQEALSAQLEVAAAQEHDQAMSSDIMAETEVEGDREASDVPATNMSSKKKKPRLHWDEQNLLSNALEKARNPYPKIDEPKTPFHVTSGSEGSCSSGSAPQSPGSPAFISRDHLVGFTDLEQRRNSSSSDIPHRSVQISEDTAASSGGESSPRSREEFETKRKMHYRHEYPHAPVPDVDDDEANMGGDEDLDDEADVSEEEEDELANDMTEDVNERGNGISKDEDSGSSSPEDEITESTVQNGAIGSDVVESDGHLESKTK